MNRDYVLLACIGILSILLLIIFVKKHQVREAFFALIVAQLFSWVLTLVYVQLGLQQNPVRLFPHATQGNFIFSFIFHPVIFAVFYVRYPKHARKGLRLLYTVLMTAVSPAAQLLASLYTNLIFIPHKSILITSYILILIIYSISRKYMDWYFYKLHLHGRGV